MNKVVSSPRSKLSRLCASVILASTVGLLSIALPMSNAQAHEEVGLLTSDGWVRASLGAGKTTAAYIILDNSHGPSDVLLSVHTPIATAAEIHTMTMEGDIMRMRRMETAPLPNGEKLEFQPGGMHLMLIGLTSKVQAGDDVPVTFVFEKMGEKTIVLKALKKAPTVAHSGDHKMPAPAKPSEMKSKMDHSMHDMMGHGAK